VETDFTALASRVAAAGELRACIVLSKDGLLLGAFPPTGETEIRPAWLRVTALGEPDRGFIAFPHETWAFVRLGPYAAFAVAPPEARPGVVLDHLEQALTVAEESRSRHDVVRPPEQIDLARQAPSPPPPAQPQTAPPPAAPAPAAVEHVDPAAAPRPEPSRARAAQEGEEVDRVSLAFELSNLLQEGYQRDE
jgi:hypothetical protein